MKKSNKDSHPCVDVERKPCECEMTSGWKKWWKNVVFWAKLSLPWTGFSSFTICFMSQRISLSLTYGSHIRQFVVCVYTSCSRNVQGPHYFTLVNIKVLYHGMFSQIIPSVLLWMHSQNPKEFFFFFFFFTGTGYLLSLSVFSIAVLLFSCFEALSGAATALSLKATLGA